MFNEQIILSGILLYIGNALKNIPMQLWSLIKSRLGVILITDSFESEAFENLDSWIISLNKKVINNHVKVNTKWDPLDDCAILYKSVGYGVFTIYKDKTIITINKNRIKDNLSVSSGRRTTEEMSIFMIGINANKLKDEINEYINKKEVESDRTFINIARINNDGSRNENRVLKRDFSTVFCHNKNTIMNHLDKFLENENIYKGHGLAYKTGVLLYGNPGTGKSSMAKVIASYLNYDIIKINVATIKSRDLERAIFDCTRRKCVLLFEDIDCAMDINRTDEDSKEKDEKKAKLGILLNFFDGVDSPSDIVFVATTNHIEELDPALIRECRFDLRFEMEELDESLAIGMCNEFDVDHNDILKDEIYPLSPSKLQNKIINTIM